jgi:hypothetical protein
MRNLEIGVSARHKAKGIRCKVKGESLKVKVKKSGPSVLEERYT